MSKRRFTLELLNDIISRDNAELISKAEKINRNTKIKYNCKCGKENEKMMRYIIEEAGALCKDCTKKHMVEKQKNTMIELYGESHPMHISDFKKKQEETLINKYGTKNPMKNEEIKNKFIKTINNRSEEEKKIINKKRKMTNQIKFGGDAPASSQIVKDKIVQTCLKKYGTEYPLQNEEMKNKLIESNIQKYGVKSTAQLENIKEKAKKTCLQRYGVVSSALVPEIKEKQKETFKNNYGVEYFSQSSIIQEKIVKTNLERYGVERPNQNQEIMEKIQKNAKKYKDYKFPSGTIRNVQGYEPFALDELIKSYTEEQIKTDRKDVPRIEYKVNEKKKYYFPDIYIPHENYIIEVKSTWTYKCKTDSIKEKAEACKSQGYKYEIWIFDGKGNKTIITEFNDVPQNEIVNNE
jgi:hypothetical protein